MSAFNPKEPFRVMVSKGVYFAASQGDEIFVMQVTEDAPKEIRAFHMISDDWAVINARNAVLNLADGKQWWSDRS